MDNSLHNLIMGSCMDESVKINQHLDLLAEENSASLRRQIAALEDISNHTKDQANSLKEHVDLLTEQVNIAHQNAIDAKKDETWYFQKVSDSQNVTDVSFDEEKEK